VREMREKADDRDREMPAPPSPPPLP
jgi:hypothetical protein